MNVTSLVGEEDYQSYLYAGIYNIISQYFSTKLI